MRAREPPLGCSISLGLPWLARTRDLRLRLGLSLSLASWMVLGCLIRPVCHTKPNCTQPGLVGGLWDLLCREQVNDTLCPFC